MLEKEKTPKTQEELVEKDSSNESICDTGQCEKMNKARQEYEDDVMKRVRGQNTKVDVFLQTLGSKRGTTFQDIIMDDAKKEDVERGEEQKRLLTNKIEGDLTYMGEKESMGPRKRDPRFSTQYRTVLRKTDTGGMEGIKLEYGIPKNLKEKPEFRINGQVINLNELSVKQLDNLVSVTQRLKANRINREKFGKEFEEQRRVDKIRETYLEHEKKKIKKREEIEKNLLERQRQELQEKQAKEAKLKREAQIKREEKQKQVGSYLKHLETEGENK